MGWHYNQISQIIGLNPQLQREKFQPRLNGKIKWVCKHGQSHTVYAPGPECGQNYDYSHNCDGCCKEIKLIKQGGGSD